MDEPKTFTAGVPDGSPFVLSINQHSRVTLRTQDGITIEFDLLPGAQVKLTGIQRDDQIGIRIDVLPLSALAPQIVK